MRFLLLLALISLFDVTTGYQRPKRYFTPVSTVNSASLVSVRGIYFYRYENKMTLLMADISGSSKTWNE